MSTVVSTVYTAQRTGRLDSTMAAVQTLRGIAFYGFVLGDFVPLTLSVIRAHQRGGRRAARDVMRRANQRALRVAGCDVQVLGADEVPDSHCVLIHNEGSVLDVLLLHAVVYDHAEIGVGAELYERTPFGAKFAEALNIVLFQRGDRDAATQMMAKVTDAVAGGSRLLIGGEGRIQKSGTVGHFKRGGCLVAIRAGVPVVPVALAGGSEILPLGALRIRPGQLTVAFGDPISTDGLAEGDAPALAQRVREEVVRMREPHRGRSR